MRPKKSFSTLREPGSGANTRARLRGLHKAEGRLHWKVAVLLIAALLLSATVRAGHAQTFTILYNFGANPQDGKSPKGFLAQGHNGSVYGTTIGGGTYGGGTMFEITPTGTLALLYSFDGISASGPGSGLTLGTDGYFYGSAGGGTAGVVFRITADGELLVLHDFTGGSDGAVPSLPVQGTDGNFYGTTSLGGRRRCGTVYRITPGAQYRKLHTFDQTNGGGPLAPLIEASDGNFYGTTYDGGSANLGTVFKITPVGAFTLLHSFDGASGSAPNAPLVQGNDGNLYGTTQFSEAGACCGVIFRITTTGAFAVLHNFSQADGTYPLGGLVQASDGFFYGTTLWGGYLDSGTIFRISAQGEFSVLYSFDGYSASNAVSNLLQHTNGTLYGTTLAGGPYLLGTLYSLELGLKPFVSLVPAAGAVGETIGILGQGFEHATSVSFHGVPAIFTVSSDNFLEAVVPEGALTGVVIVASPTVRLAGDKPFRVTPSILDFDPPSGPVGTPVVIRGRSLTQTMRVAFGGVKATSFTVDSDTQVSTIVPTGAQTGKIVIKTPGGIASSPTAFTVTP